MARPLTPGEDRRIKEGIPKVTVVKVSFYRMRSDGFWNTKGCVIQCQGWKVEQISFITGTRSVDKQDLSKNLKFFRVPEDSINSIYSKLTTRVFDVYANTLKCMYIIRFSGDATRSEASSDDQPTPFVVTSLTHTIDTLPKPDNLKRRKKESPEVNDK